MVAPMPLKYDVWRGPRSLTYRRAVPEALLDGIFLFRRLLTSSVQRWFVEWNALFGGFELT